MTNLNIFIIFVLVLVQWMVLGLDQNTTQNTNDDDMLNWTSTATMEGIDENDPLWGTYKKCEWSLGRKSVTCDPENTLDVYNARKGVDDVLWRMQTDVPCYCDSARFCTPYVEVPIQSGMLAILISFKGGDLPDNLDRVASQIYTDAVTKHQLARSSKPGTDENIDTADQCDNGLLFIYAMDTRSLFIFPGSAIKSIFDYLPTRRRRIEPESLMGYLQGTLNLLKKPSEGSGVERVAYGRSGWTGWEMLVGMIVAVVIVVVTVAVLVSLFLNGCCGRRKSEISIQRQYRDEVAAYKRYEKACKEWAKRARYLAKQRAKMTRAMRNSNWDEKVDAAKRRLNKNPSMVTIVTGQSDPTNPDGRQQSPPYYIVTEPNSIYNSNFMPNWSSGEDSGNQETSGTLRSNRNTTTAGQTSLDRKKTMKKETQRRDFYFQNE